MGTTAYKLSYLRNTKSLLKDKVNELVGDITDETTFAEYAEEIKNLYDDLPKITESGSSITLSNTKNGKMTIQPKGNITQATSILPSEYQQVEYIERNTGNCWLVIPNVLMTQNSKVVAYAEATETSDSSTAFFGARQQDVSIDNKFLSFMRLYQGETNYSWAPQFDGQTPTGNPKVGNGKVRAEMSKNGLYCDDTLVTNFTGYSNFSFTNDFAIFGFMETSTFDGRMFKGKIYDFKYYNEDTLVFSLIPCYRKSDTEIGMYDVVNNVFYTNQGDGTFLKGSNVSIPNPDYPQDIQVVKGSNNVWVGYGILPSEYQQIEYIEGTGTQYIDLEFKGTKDHGIEMECAFTSTSSNAVARLFGTREGSGGTGAFAYISSSNGNCNGTYYIASNGVSAGSSTFAQIDTNYHNIKINIDNDKKVYFDNNLIFTGNNTEYTATYNTRLFNSYNGTSWMSTCASAKIKTLKIYENTTLVKNFVPCYRKSDNVIGLYDLVNNVFYTNDGTGIFLKGNDVNSQNFSLSLGNIELCKIGDYSDVIFKNEPNNPLYNSSLVENAWYKKANIGKLVLAGQSFAGFVNGTLIHMYTQYNSMFGQKLISGTFTKAICNREVVQYTTYNAPTGTLYVSSNGEEMTITNSNLTTKEEWQQYFQEYPHIIYGVLSTPTYTQITDTTLVGQLEQLNRIIIPNDNTLIVTTDSESSNAQLIVNASALKTWEVT